MGTDKNQHQDPQYNGSNNYGYNPHPYGMPSYAGGGVNDTYRQTDLSKTSDPAHLDRTKWTEDSPEHPD